MDNIRIRLAKKTDFQDVLEMSEGIYSGHDYLPCAFLRWLDDPNRTVLIGEKDNKAVGLTVIFIVDEGKTLISEATRLHVNYRRRGIGKRFGQVIQQYVQEHFPDVRIERFAVSAFSVESMAQALNEPNNSLFLKLGDVHVYVNPSQLATGIINHYSVANKSTEVKRLTSAEFGTFLKQGKLNALLTNNTMVVDRRPFKALPSNIPKGLVHENDCFFASFGVETVESLSHCQRSERVKCPEWCATFYTMEKELLQVHIMKQLENAILHDREKQFMFVCLVNTSMIQHASQLLDDLLLENANVLTRGKKNSHLSLFERIIARKKAHL